MNITPLSIRDQILRFRSACVLIAAVLLATIFVNGCTNNANDLNGPFAGSGQTETTTIFGRVLDESGAPLSGVTVSAQTMTATTDANGLYVIKNAVVPKGRAVVLATKAGYFDGAKAESPRSDGTTRIELSMMTNVATYTVSSASGGKVTITGTNGASITFAANSFLNSDGSAYSGSVKVAARYLDPKNPSYFDFFSGDNVARSSAGNQVALISSGVIRAQLQSPSGQELKLDPAKPATLTYPKPLDTKAPTTMPLWYYDETIGMWKQEGKADLTGNSYVGTVTHFTDWNLDYFDSSGSFSTSGTVSLRVACNGVPISGVLISIVGDDAPGKYFVHPGGKTGSDGTITFLRFPANRPVKIDIRSDKNNGLYYVNTPIDVTITPGQILDLGDIALSSPCPASIKGNLVGCDDKAAEGLITITDGTNLTYSYTKSGEIAMQAQSGKLLTLDAMDVNGNHATSVIIDPLGSGEQKAIGTIKVCGPITSNFVDITTPGLTSGDSSSGNLTFSPDGSLLGTVGSDATVRIFETATGNKVLEFAIGSDRFYGTSIHFTKDNSHVLISSTYSFQGVDIYSIAGGVATKVCSNSPVLFPFLFDDGSAFIGNDPSTGIGVYSTGTATLQKSLNATGGAMKGPNGFIQSEKSFIYMNGLTCTVWDIATDAQLRTIPITGSIYAVSDDGERLASSSDGKTYSIYNTLTGQKVTDVVTSQLPGTNYYPVIALTKGGLYVAGSVGGAAVINCYSTADGSLVSTKLNSATAGERGALTASRGDEYLASKGKGTVRLWKLK
ncbi:MAG TPA: carboxypeptidase regulatory-like domain-containing protein [Candidatus Kapabacteria bacterium]|nr:carboxypeptidase regulatory-like domain-containing protein [Candidatus Kapabacteria bacterium]